MKAVACLLAAVLILGCKSEKVRNWERFANGTDQVGRPIPLHQRVWACRFLQDERRPVPAVCAALARQQIEEVLAKGKPLVSKTGNSGVDYDCTEGLIAFPLLPAGSPLVERIKKACECDASLPERCRGAPLLAPLPD